MMQYLMWRILTGRHTNITYSFLVVGHTKFSPDWSFGLFKHLYWRTKVNTISDIASVVDKSAHCNTSQVACDEKGSTNVPFFDWSAYLGPHFKRIVNIKKYHHFRFSFANPGIVYIKLNADSLEEEIKIIGNLH